MSLLVDDKIDGPSAPILVMNGAKGAQAASGPHFDVDDALHL